MFNFGFVGNDPFIGVKNNFKMTGPEQFSVMGLQKAEAVVT